MNMIRNKQEENNYISELDEDIVINDEQDNEDSEDVFAEFTGKVQSLLDEGAISLEIAEEKTAELEGMDVESEDYQLLVEEIRIAQDQARSCFEDAEFLIKRANEILEENA